ncbi:MAG TPA: DivIVA domain-containing protein [Candidatus Lustribacter sp.]
MSANSRITVVDIQHRSFKRALQGYDRVDVDKFLDEIIESLEDEATARAALEAEIADLKERISHFKAMEVSLQSTLLLAQRTADEVKAAAHKEADLIKQEARLQSEREIGSLGERVDESRREHQRMLDIADKAKSEIRGLVLSYLALIDRTPYDAASAPTPPAMETVAAPPAAAPPVTQPTVAAVTHVTVEPSQSDDTPPLPLNHASAARLDVF